MMNLDQVIHNFMNQPNVLGYRMQQAVGYRDALPPVVRSRPANIKTSWRISGAWMTSSWRPTSWTNR